MLDNVVPISTASREEAVARTASGETVTISDCEGILAEKLGYKFNLLVSDSEFKVTMVYPGELPERKLRAFLVVNDSGFPFLLGYTVMSFGVDVVHNCYINPLLEQDLRVINQVEVMEVAGELQRSYRVALRHSFE